MTDPRHHPHAVSSDGRAIVYVCGCSNEVDPASGVLRSLVKCPRHRRAMRDPRALDAAYYAELGTVDAAGRPLATAHVAELAEALGEFPLAGPGSLALEVGGGASPYVAAVRRAGYLYVGVDPSPWAARWARDTHGVVVYAADFEAMGSLALTGFSLILAAHSLEHMADAPGAIRRCAGLLAPGGELWVVVPDDSDPCNPDHVFFFDQHSLRFCLESAGLNVVKMWIRRYVKHENFVYARARKAD